MEEELEFLGHNIKCLARDWFVKATSVSCMSDRMFTSLFSFTTAYHTALWLAARESFAENDLSLRDYLATWRCMTDPPKNLEGWEHSLQHRQNPGPS